MSNHAGIAYTFLHLADTARIPFLLALQAPVLP